METTIHVVVGVHNSVFAVVKLQYNLLQLIGLQQLYPRLANLLFLLAGAGGCSDVFTAVRPNLAGIINEGERY